MRPILMFLFALLLSCSVTQPAEAGPSRDRVALAETMRGQTVALVMDDGLFSLMPYCAGVWLSSSTILTALHCVDGDAIVGFVTYEDVYPHGTQTPDLFMQARPAITYAIDREHDLALIRAIKPPTGHGVAHTRIGTVKQGTLAQTMGHSRGLWFSYSSGDVAAVRQTDLEGDGHDVLFVQCTTPTSAGNSGGGLFDGEGALIGVAHATAKKGQLLNFYMHPSYIDALVAQVRKDGTL